MSRIRLSPSRLVALCCVGYLVVCSGFLVLDLQKRYSPFVHVIGFWPWLLASLAIMAFGGIIVYKAQEALGEGVRLERWSREELRGPRQFVEHRAVRVVEILALAMAVAILVAQLVLKNPRLNGFCWPLIYMPMLFRALRTALKEPRTSQTPTHFEKLAPLQSEHWGGDASRS